MRYLRTNTATIVTVGPFYDKTTGVDIETGLTITNERITFVVDLNNGSAPTLVLDNVTGATSGTANDLNYITNCDAGLMQLELAAADVNYLGRAMLSVTDAANHVPVFHEFTILPANVYDALILGAGTDLLDVNVAQVSEDASAADNLELACDNYSATRGLTGTALPAAAADAAGGVPISDAGGLDLDAKLANTNEVTAARMGALTDWINGGRLDLILDAILVDTGTTLQGELDGIQADTEDIQAKIGTPANLGGGTATLAGNLVDIEGQTDDIGAAGAGLTAITDRLLSLALTTGTVTADAGNTASSFQTNLAGADDFWNDCLILITSGALAGQVKEIGDFADVDGVVTLTSGQAFTGVPAGDVTFAIINR